MALSDTVTGCRNGPGFCGRESVVCSSSAAGKFATLVASSFGEFNDFPLRDPR